jgi:hypothetical protein
MAITRRFGEVNAGDLGKFSTEDLVIIYNELASPPVQGFDSYTHALKAVIKLLTEPEKPARLKVGPTAGPLSRPVLFVPQRPYRPGTKLARLIEALYRGATLEECKSIVSNARHYLIRVIHQEKGFGLEVRDDGKIYLLTERSTGK